MAAPLEAYVNYKYNTITSASTLVQHSLAIPTDDATTLKNRFYLDKLYQVQTASGTTFIGGCKLGSFNYQHHNTGRIGALRSRAEDMAEVVYFTDAGLNTKGYAQRGSTGMLPVNYANYIVIPTTYISSYYNDTIRVFWQVRRVGETEFNKQLNFDGFPAQQTKNEDAVLVWKIPVFESHENIELRPCIENSEGVFYGEILQLSLGNSLEIYNAYFTGSNASCTGGDSVTLIMDSTHSYLYKEVNNTNGNLVPAAFGWYTGFFNLGKKERVLINLSGQIISRSDCVDEGGTDPVKQLVVGAGRDFTAPGQPSKFSCSVRRTEEISSDVIVTINLAVKNSSGSIIQSLTVELTLVAGGAVAVNSESFPMPTGGKNVTVISATNNAALTISY